MSAIASSEGQTPGESMDRRERMVLYLLIQDPSPWTIEELGREVGDQRGTSDAVAALVSTGHVYRLGEFVIPTRSARRSDELYEGAI
jgi:hypothetical protein